MIRLFAENPGQANPNLAFRWCVDRKTLDELERKNVKNPQLLLVVAQHPDQFSVREIERKLVPLDQAMEWLAFNRPGRYTIHTTIVWDNDNRLLFEAQSLLARRSGESRFRWEMFDCDGKFSHIHWTEIGRHSLDEGSLDVVVAKEFFAKEPPAWLNWWVNFWFRAMEISQPTNQCSFRRRAILAFTIQPIPVFIWALLKSSVRLAVAMVLALCGMRCVSFKPVIHPFELCLDNVWLYMGSSVFLKNKHGEWHFAYIIGPISRRLQAIWRALLPPPSSEELGRKQQAKMNRILEKSVKRAFKEKEKQEQEQRKLGVFYEELQDVACIGVPLKPRLELLPEKRRTIYLRYMDLKTKVCKPYAR